MTRRRPPDFVPPPSPFGTDDDDFFAIAPPAEDSFFLDVVDEGIEGIDRARVGWKVKEGSGAGDAVPVECAVWGGARGGEADSPRPAANRPATIGHRGGSLDVPLVRATSYDVLVPLRNVHKKRSYRTTQEVPRFDHVRSRAGARDHRLTREEDEGLVCVSLIWKRTPKSSAGPRTLCCSRVHLAEIDRGSQESVRHDVLDRDVHTGARCGSLRYMSEKYDMIASRRSSSVAAPVTTTPPVPKTSAVVEGEFRRRRHAAKDPCCTLPHTSTRPLERKLVPKERRSDDISDRAVDDDTLGARPPPSSLPPASVGPPGWRLAAAREDGARRYPHRRLLGDRLAASCAAELERSLLTASCRPSRRLTRQIVLPADEEDSLDVF